MSSMRYTSMEVVVLASNIARFCPTVLRLPGPVSADCAPVLKTVHVVCANGDALTKTA